jgi:hypothetical protein
VCGYTSLLRKEVPTNAAVGYQSIVKVAVRYTVRKRNNRCLVVIQKVTP